MDLFASSGSRWRRRGLPALVGALCLTVTTAVVVALDQNRVTPDLARISERYAQLEQSRRRLEALPPVRPVHWQLRRLRRLARALPDMHGLKVIEADPTHYSEVVQEKIGGFGGTVWKVAAQGSFSSVVWLCRTAQPLMPLIVDTVQAQGGTANAVLFVLGAPPDVRGKA